MKKENFTKVIRFLGITNKEIKHRRRYIGKIYWTNRNKKHIKWSNFKEIENWAKKRNYETFRKENRLFLLIGREIFIYFKEKSREI